MGRPSLNLIGRRFGKLSIIKKSEKVDNSKASFWECLCDCGNVVVYKGSNLTRKGRSNKSCGCLRFHDTNEAFIRKTEWVGECLEWTMGINTYGYGMHKKRQAHRVAYELSHGEIPKGMFVCHTCDNPKCCNPLHLFLGTPKENSEDRDGKGRGPIGERGGAAKLTDKDVLEIRKKYSPERNPSRKLAREYDVSKTAILRVINRKTWSHI